MNPAPTPSPCIALACHELADPASAAKGVRYCVRCREQVEHHIHMIEPMATQARHSVSYRTRHNIPVIHPAHRVARA